MWIKSHRIKSKVIETNSDCFAQDELVLLNQQSSPLHQNRGRPRISIVDCSERTKRRRIADIAEFDISAADDLRMACKQPNPWIFPAKACEAISLITDANLTKHLYLLIRSFINNKLDIGFLPCNDSILNEKQKSYPEQITVSESVAEVELQNLLDHTASQI